MTHKIFIDGEAGTTGLEINKRLSDHSDIELLHIDTKMRKDREERLRLYEEADIVFLCLPDSESKSIAAGASKDTRIIDASSAHRTDGNWIYGLPELDIEQRNRIRTADRVSNPGCHATGFILLTRPLVDMGIINNDTPLSSYSITGYSGGGKAMISEYEKYGKEDKGEVGSPGQYGLSQQHKHLPEMTKWSKLDISPVFAPIVADYYRGMLVSIPVHRDLLGGKTDLEDIYEFYRQRYENEPLISVSKADDTAVNGFIYVEGLKGRDDLEIIISGNDRRMTLMARYDNLGKGASGAAIQNMNIMLGRPEYEGLIR